MSQPDRDSETPDSPSDRSAEVVVRRAAEYEELRNLLLGQEIRELEELRQRLDDRVARATEVASVLPEAVAVREGKDDRLGRALQPTVDTALKEAVHRDPKAVADALFPILGPAIRKAISATILGMIQSLNHVLNQSFSIRGLRWRIQAWRSGVPYAEVVLLNTLVYRVEQVLLIHRETGLLLEHVAAPDVKEQDTDVVSGMLSAIQNFMDDSFSEDAGSRLDTIRVGGDRSLWVEEGPHTVLSVLIRGTPPVELRHRLTDVLTEIQASHRSLLEHFEGDTSPFAMLRDQLEGLLESRFNQERTRVTPATWAVVGLVLLVPLVWGAFAFFERQRVDSLLDLLADQEGIVVTDVERSDGRLLVSGLLDEYAVPPESLSALAGFEPGDVEFALRPYQAMTPGVVLSRATALLEVPEGVSLAFEDGTLTVAGTAPEGWTRFLVEKAGYLPGVTDVNTERLSSADLDGYRAIVRALESVELHAIVGSVQLLPGQSESLDEVAARINNLLGLQESLGILARVVVTGYSDPTGGEEFNRRLSLRRAESVQRLLVARGVSAGALVAVGGGISFLGDSTDTESGVNRDRRITFRVLKAQVTTGWVR